MITLAQAKAKLQSYLDAEERILAGQSHTFNGRSVTMANLADIQKGRAYWESKVAQLSGRRRSRVAMFGGRA